MENVEKAQKIQHSKPGSGSRLGYVFQPICGHLGILGVACGHLDNESANQTQAHQYQDQDQSQFQGAEKTFDFDQDVRRTQVPFFADRVQFAYPRCGKAD